MRTRLCTGILLLSALVTIIGCSEVGFKGLPNKLCTDFNTGSGQDCAPGPQGSDRYTVNFRTGQVDILFVNDNSGSMSPEQAKMANAFPNFLQSIQNLDYQIAMVTTDVKNQNGKLLEFKDEQGRASGEYVLRPTTENRESKFRGTIKRQETLDCEQSGYAADKCPADDERGIYAMNLVLENNERGFLRTGAHLAIIVLSDEDQRSRTTFNTQTQKWEGAIRGYPLEERDMPETLVKTLASRHSTKTLSVHAVIIKPGDAVCYNQQRVNLSNGFTLFGSYGYLYHILTIPQNHGLESLGNILPGTSSSICSDQFGYQTQLGVIGSLSAASARATKIQMACLPKPEDITVTAAQNVTYTIEESTRSLVFRNLPIALDISVSYLCPNR